MRRVLLLLAVVAATFVSPASADVCAGGLCAISGCNGTVNVCGGTTSCSGTVSVCPFSHPGNCHSTIDVCFGPIESECDPCVARP